ncbi:MAG: PAS domain-containing hybrid sensor histidine kinase/response regulator, partial [Gemmataceae bacterium]
DWIEVVLVLIVVVGVTLYWFTGPKAAMNRLPIPTLAILVMLANWIAFRLGTHGMATFSIVVAAVVGISRVVDGESPSGFLTYEAHLELAADCFGLGAVLCFHLGLAAAARRHSLRESEREQLLLTEYAQSDRVRNLNEKLSLQALEMADQARQFEEQRDQYQQLADELTLKRAFQDAMLDQLPVGILVSDHTGRVLQNNPEFLRMVGAAPDAELAHLQDYRGWPAFRMDGTQLAYDDYPLVQTLKTGRPTPPSELRIRLPDGREQPLAASATPIFSHSNTQIGAVLVLHDLNAIRQAERQVAQSEERLQFTLRSARMIAWDWNLTSGEITRSSPLEGWLGLPTDIKYTVTGSFADRLHPDDRTHALETMDALRRGALTDCEFAYRLQHVDGHYVWLESRGRAIRDSNNQPTGQLTGVLIDISERKQAEERLRLLESAVVHAQDAIIVLEAQPEPGRGRSVLYINEAFTRITGYNASDVIGRSLHFLRGPRTDSRTLNQLRDALENQHEFKGELLNYHKDGHEVWMDVSLVPVYGPRGNCQFFVMIQRDVTDRRRAEEALRESEQLFRSMFEGTSAGVSMTDAQGIFVSCNRSYAAMLGRSMSDIIGHHPREFTHPDDFQIQTPLLEEFLAGTRSQYQLRKRYIRPDGKIIATELSVSAVNDSDGRLLYGMGVSVDVTEQTNLEDQLRQSQKMEALGQLAGGVAHDFNNLLTAILGNLKLVTLQPDDPNRKLLQTVETASTRAADLTRKLLGYARRNQILVAPVDPASLFTEVFDILGRTLDPRIRIKIVPSATLPVRADATLIVHALLNLCLNARDAMPHGGTITLEAEEVEIGEEDALSMTDARSGLFVHHIRDTGVGMSPDVMQRLFEPFFTTKGVGRGTGLGLPMVQGIMRQHEGWVTVQSAPETGTEFVLYLPIAMPTATNTVPPRLDPSMSSTAIVPVASGPAPSKEPITILLVDDESMIRMLARTVLESAGHTVIEACDGLEAVELYREQSETIDLIILDVTMPRMSGRDAFQLMIEHDRSARVIFSSGYSADDLSEVGGSYGLLSKPYRPQDLLTAVQKASEEQERPALVELSQELVS